MCRPSPLAPSILP
ncbi:unnamed protein product, partial [Rotaria magnacalcarata]